MLSHSGQMQTDTVFQDREPFDLMKTVFQFCWFKSSRVVVLLIQYDAPHGSKCDKAKVLFFLSFFFSWLQTRGAQHISGCGDGGIFLATQPSSVPDGSCPTHRNLTNNTKKKKKRKRMKDGPVGIRVRKKSSSSSLQSASFDRFSLHMYLFICT